MITISGSVGKNGTNNAPDVKLIQDMLNASDAIAPIKVDHRYGPATFKAILQFQMTVFPSHADWDGLIGRNGKTIRALANPSQRFMRQVIAAEVNAQAIRLGGFGPSQKSATATAAAPGKVVPLKGVTSAYKGLSGTRWCAEFPTSRSTSDLASPFREQVEQFRAAMKRAGIESQIAATFRPLQRAWLMHWAYNIAHGFDATNVPAHAGIHINWVHVDGKGSYDAAASKKAAADMSREYKTVHKPSLTSMHITGNAIDMSMSWGKAVSIVNAHGQSVLLPPSSGKDSKELHRVGATFGVLKLVSDAPHWSSSGN